MISMTTTNIVQTVGWNISKGTILVIVVIVVDRSLRMKNYMCYQIGHLIGSVPHLIIYPI